MIVVDANVFLRALIEPQESYNRWMYDEATELFRQAARGEIQLLTSTAVIAEVAFMLTSRNVYAYRVEDTAARMETIVSIPNVHLDRKADTLRALRLWEERPSIGFVDAPLATFDKGLRRFDWIERHRWQSEP